MRQDRTSKAKDIDTFGRGGFIKSFALRKKFPTKILKQEMDTQHLQTYRTYNTYLPKGKKRIE